MSQRVVSVALRDPLRFDRAVPYRELRDPPLPDDLRALALACFGAQRRAAAGRSDGVAPMLASAPRGVDAREDIAASVAAPGSPGKAAVSARALEEAVARGDVVGGIVRRREIATAIPFNARHASEVVWSRAVAARRRRLDVALTSWVRALFAPGLRPILHPAGHWWYPPGTHFGWHTNRDYPGWRLYLSHAEDEGRSFFRYRNPVSGEVVTSLDGRWHLRFFEVSAERHLWHAIYSETDRFSVGWIVRPWSLREVAVAGVKRLGERIVELRATAAGRNRNGDRRTGSGGEST